MNNEDLLEAIGEADEKMLEQSERRGAPMGWIAAITAAACLVFCICGWLLLDRGAPVLPDPSSTWPNMQSFPSSGTHDPTSPTWHTQPATIPTFPVKPPATQLICLQAQMLKDPNAYDGGTNKYVEHYTLSLEEEKLPAPVYMETLPVYKTTPLGPGKALTEAYFRKYQSAWEYLFDITISVVEAEEETLWGDDPVWYVISNALDFENVALRARATKNYFSCWVCATIPGDDRRLETHDGRLETHDGYVSIMRTDSKEVIREKITPLIEELNRAFAKNFTGIEIEYTDYGYLHVMLFDYADCPISEGLPVVESPLSYLELSFAMEGANNYQDNWNAEPGEAYLLYIDYFEQTLSWEFYESPMLTLEEAEELLEKGYVFSGHICSLCEAIQDEVDFSHYDAVTLSYELRSDGYVVPFYVFYKYLKTDKNGMQCYAKTMVPAVQVEGLDEYFEAQKDYHS